MQIEPAPTTSLTQPVQQGSPFPLVPSLADREPPCSAPTTQRSALHYLPATLVFALGLQSNVGLASPDLAKGLEWTSDASIASSLTSEQEFTKFRRRILATLVDNPFIEDGFNHPVDDVLASHIKNHPLRGLGEVALMLDRASTSQQAAVLRSLGRLQQPPKRDQFLNIFRSALRSRELEVRDAAISSLELLDTGASLSVLRDHAPRESDRWLAEYIESVLEE